nr:hypothetical protein [uncultured Sphingomonas sp.]
MSAIEDHGETLVRIGRVRIEAPSPLLARRLADGLGDALARRLQDGNEPAARRASLSDRAAERIVDAIEQTWEQRL